MKNLNTRDKKLLAIVGIISVLIFIVFFNRASNEEIGTNDDLPGIITEAPDESISKTIDSDGAEKTETAPKETSAAESAAEEPAADETDGSVDAVDNENYKVYKFRSKKLLDQHYNKHGKEMGFSSAEEYESAASDVINSPEALYKLEAEDGDGVYYIESTNEFVILSTDGYIRTYFNPSGGKAYFDRQ